MFVDDVVCGDSERLLKLVPDGSVDLVFTSPPYNAGMKYDVYNDSVVWVLLLLIRLLWLIRLLVLL